MAPGQTPQPRGPEKHRRFKYAAVPPQAPLKVDAYFKDVEQLSCVGVPHFEETVVDRCDDHGVMAIP